MKYILLYTLCIGLRMIHVRSNLTKDYAAGLKSGNRLIPARIYDIVPIGISMANLKMR